MQRCASINPRLVRKGLPLLLALALFTSSCDEPQQRPPTPPPWEALTQTRPTTLWLAQNDYPLGSVWARTATSGWVEVSEDVLWESSEPDILRVENARAQTQGAGHARLTARIGDLQASRWVRVLDQAPTALAVWPSQLSLVSGSQHALSLVASSPAGPIQARALVTWSSSAPDVASVDPQGARVLAHAPGRATIYAQLSGVRARIEVTVEDAAAQRLDIEPVLTTIPISSALALHARALVDGTTHDVTHTARWSTSDARVARVVGTTLYTYTPGDVVLSASGLGQERSVKLTVREEPIEALELTPASLTFTPGNTASIRAIARIDGGQLELTQSAQWEAQQPLESGHLWGAGELYAPTSGTSRVVASFGGKSAQVVALIEPPDALPDQTLKLDPSTLSLPLGTSFPVEARRADTAALLTAHATWWSEDPSVAFVGVDALNRGRVRAVGPGLTTIWARWGDALARMDVRVTRAALTRIELTPQAANVPIGYRGQYSATGIFDDGSSLYITQEVTWDSDSPQTVHVHNAPGRQGRSVAQSEGPTTVRASWRGVSGVTSVEVSPGRE